MTFLADERRGLVDVMEIGDEGDSACAIGIRERVNASAARSREEAGVPNFRQARSLSATATHVSQSVGLSGYEATDSL